MAALVAAIRAALGQLGFTAAAALTITDDQDMDLLDKFKFLDNKQVEQLCRVV